MNQIQEVRPFHTSIYAALVQVDRNKLIEDILKIKETDPGVVISNAGGWQSKSYTSSQTPFLQELIDEITLRVNAVYDLMRVSNEAKLDNYWFNVNNKYNFNKTHAHALAYYSAVYYLKCPTNSGEIFFERPDNLRETIPFSETTENNWGEYWLKPQEGSLFIFPSFLRHYVSQNLTEDADDARISIAFNYR